MQRPARAALWTVGAIIALFAVLGVAAIAPTMSDSLDSSSNEDPPATARAAANGLRNVRCAECGVVESVRPIGRDGAGQGGVAADVAAANGYAITVRLRDGSRTVLSEARPGTWRPGSRVLVISRAAAANE